MSEVFHEGVQVMRQWDDESTDRLPPNPFVRAVLEYVLVHAFIRPFNTQHARPAMRD